MVTSEELQKLLDEATPGPWRLGSWQDNVFGTGPKDEWLPICRVKRDDAPIEESRDHVDARLIAAAPDLAAELIRVRQERDELREALGNLYAASSGYLSPDDPARRSARAALAKWGA